MSAYHDARLLDPPATSRVLVALADGPVAFADVMRKTELKSSTLSMTLRRMSDRGQVRASDGMWWLATLPEYAYSLEWTRGI